MLGKREKDVLIYFSRQDAALCSRPFKKAAVKLGLTENRLLAVLRDLQAKGVIKNLRGVIDHRQAGYRTNALIAWNTRGLRPAEKDDFIQARLVSDERISHCYQRQSQPGFDYDVFAMLHAKSAAEVKRFVRETTRQKKIAHEILFTEQELKKEKMSFKDLLE
ncbi:MAG: hypothetical protein HQL23_02640 [Candidatus Omnitrophica bacterium]|nr:hypothetical protein [Candidatus Omnitrophota bacterium]